MERSGDGSPRTVAEGRGKPPNPSPRSFVGSMLGLARLFFHLQFRIGSVCNGSAEVARNLGSPYRYGFVLGMCLGRFLSTPEAMPLTKQLT
jgi:hypothetical protein